MYVPTAPAPHVSPRVRELAQLIVEVIRSFRQRYPNVSFPEIRQALRIAEMNARGEIKGTSQEMQRMIAVLVGVLILGFGVALFASRQSVDPENVLWIIVAFAVAVVGIIAVLFARRH